MNNKIHTISIKKFPLLPNVNPNAKREGDGSSFTKFNTNYFDMVINKMEGFGINFSNV